jgi:putative flippase GtrA
MGLGFILFAFLHLYPWLSTAIGAVVGGVVNCCINYRFTFHAQGCSKKAVAVKYIIVWFGSLLFNSAGTALFYELLKSMTFLQNWGFKPDGYYAVARLVVSLIVSLLWNYLMQKNFVYRRTSFDPKAIKLVDTIQLKRKVD